VLIYLEIMSIQALTSKNKTYFRATTIFFDFRSKLIETGILIRVFPVIP